jgi:DNA invertase Pin-like site-specific DNA recombinase
MRNRKAAVYCRSAVGNENAIEQQTAQIRKFAAENEYEDPTLYRDKGANGNSLDRPAMTKLIGDIRTGKTGAVIVTDTARVARNFTIFTEWRELLNRHSVQFITLDAAMSDIIYRRQRGDHLLPTLARNDMPEAPPRTLRYDADNLRRVLFRFPLN